MAIWQLITSLIPREWADRHEDHLSLLFDDIGYDTEIAWENVSPPENLPEVLSEVLPPARSWHRDLLCWGDEKSHDIQVWLENGKVGGIDIRLDLNRDLKSMIKSVVAVARELDCKLFFPEIGLITQADEYEMINVINQASGKEILIN